MAMSSDLTHGLHLRHWLIDMLDKGKFDGLEWTDSSRKYFRLPWPQKDHPGCDKFYCMLLAWSQYKNRQEKPNAKYDYSTLKANFRNSLNKCSDFLLDKEKTETFKQSDNFKIYRVLSPKEVKERKAEKVKKCTKKSFNPNRDDGKRKILDVKDLDVVPSFQQPVSSKYRKHNNLDQQNVEADSLQFDKSSFATATGEQISQQHQSYGNYQKANDEFVVSPPPSLDWNFSPVSDHQCTDDATTHSYLADLLSIDGNRNYRDISQKTHSVKILNQNQANGNGPTSSLKQYLTEIGISTDEFHRCQFSVYYSSNMVLDEVLNKTEQGYRICYGDQNVVYDLLPLQYFTEEQILDFTQFELINLPPPSGGSNLSQSLRMFDLGVIFRYDPSTFSFFMKRKCQSHVYYMDPHSDSEYQKPIKLGREDEICVFSYTKYFIELQTCNGNLPNTTILISIGSKSIIDNKYGSSVGIKIELVPIILKDLWKKIPMKDASEVSLHFSHATQFEELLREMKLS